VVVTIKAVGTTKDFIQGRKDPVELLEWYKVQLVLTPE
jgi:hypothetical protein